MTRYWVLKTRGDSDIDPQTKEPREYWPNFLREGVVAIGWALSTKLRQKRPNLEDITFEDLVGDLLRTSYTTGDDTARTEQAKKAAPTIRKFITEIGCGDKILLCQGYAPNQKKDVHIYGCAEVECQARYDESSGWWWLKRKAKIQPRQCDVPKAQLAQILGKGSLRQTLHEIEGSDFQEVCRWLDSLIGLS